MIDRYSYSNPLIAGVVIFILISMLIAGGIVPQSVRIWKMCESATCQATKLFTLLNS